MDQDLMRAQAKEHEAWQLAMAEFRLVFPDQDPNDEKFNCLFRSLELWGERLAALRIQGERSVAVRALDDKIRGYERADVARRDRAPRTLNPTRDS